MGLGQSREGLSLSKDAATDVALSRYGGRDGDTPARYGSEMLGTNPGWVSWHEASAQNLLSDEDLRVAAEREITEMTEVALDTLDRVLDAGRPETTPRRLALVTGTGHAALSAHREIQAIGGLPLGAQLLPEPAEASTLYLAA